MNAATQNEETGDAPTDNSAEAEAAFTAAFEGEDDKPRLPEQGDASESVEDGGDDKAGEVASAGDSDPNAGESDAGADDEEQAAVAADDDPYKDIPPAVANRLRAIEERITGEIRKVNGRFGPLTAKLNTLEEVAGSASAASAQAGEVAEQVRSEGGAAPTKGKISEAMKSNEKLQELREDFPDWAESMDALAEFADGRIEEIANLGGGVSQQTVGEMLAQLREDITIEIKHSNWVQTVSSDDFKQFVSGADEEAQQLYASDDPADVIALLDKYRDAKTAAESGDEGNASQNAESHQRDQRLRDNAPPTRGNRPPPRRSSQTAEEAFNQGFAEG